MKNILSALLLISFGAIAQNTRPFVGVSVYRHTDFDESVIGDFKTGVEYKVFYFLMPEIEINFMYGVPEGTTNRDDTGLVVSEYVRRVSAVNYSFCPKIILGNKNPDGSGYLQILPKYTYSNIQASEFAFVRNPNNLSQPIEKKEKVSDRQHSFGIGLGYDLELSGNNGQSISLNIYLNGIDLGKALNKLESNKKFNTKYVIGFGVNYYFSFKKRTI